MTLKLISLDFTSKTQETQENTSNVKKSLEFRIFSNCQQGFCHTQQLLALKLALVHLIFLF